MALSSDKKFSVLFVCLGNICRSAAAESIMKHILQKKGLENEIEVDSCGTGGGAGNWYKPGGSGLHDGDTAHEDMIDALRKRGIDSVSISRCLKPSDLDKFDLVLAMDKQNARDIKSAAKYWGDDYLNLAEAKTELFCTYCTKHKEKEVPDPYYYGGFGKVADLIEDGCQGVLRHFESQM